MVETSCCERSCLRGDLPMNTHISRISCDMTTGPVIEQLEGRRLLSASIDGSGVLRVDGTSGNDRVVVFTDPADATKLDVKFNKEAVQQFDKSAIVSMRIDVRGGDDVVAIGADVDIDAKIYGGAGNDSLQGGLGDDRIYAGTGDDNVNGQGGKDIEYG